MLEHIAQDDLEALGGGGSLETFGDFGGHTGIGFAGDDFFRLFDNFGCQVTGTWTDFEDDLGKALARGRC